jgi:Uma2 family endonuclease
MSAPLKTDPSPEQSRLPQRPPRLPAGTTYEEFLEWADEDTLAEWVDGIIVMTSPASLKHQRIVKFLVRLLSTYCEMYELGEIMLPPFQMKLAHAGREPDLMFVTTDHLDRFKHTYLDGPADLVVEIISPESQGRDRLDKFSEYSKAGIPEYWLIDPLADQAEFYQLDESGHYQAAALEDGIYRSRVLPGFWLKVEWLWRQPMPDPTDALLKIDRDAYVRYFQERMERDDL